MSIPSNDLPTPCHRHSNALPTGCVFQPPITPMALEHRLGMEGGFHRWTKWKRVNATMTMRFEPLLIWREYANGAGVPRTMPPFPGPIALRFYAAL